jgi:tRNA1Val (adenine37-N6)-methyltransferase
MTLCLFSIYSALYSQNMSTFHFKQFSVIQTNAAMKIGTDSVILGCVVDTSFKSRILDIGTGTGLLALMLAQKSNAIIDAVEINEEAAKEAIQNFAESKWKWQLNCIQGPIQSHLDSFKYDLIITNPPYYRHKHQFSIEDLQRKQARHDKDLPLEDLITTVNKHLSIDGSFWCILPIPEAEIFIPLCQKAGLNVHSLFYIHSKVGKNPNRLIMHFEKKPTWNVLENHIDIYDENGKPTEQYKELTHSYYLWKGDNVTINLKW